jgi:enamine deaminase RidA (YjgF/YER057c/UK114 family)
MLPAAWQRQSRGIVGDHSRLIYRFWSIRSKRGRTMSAEARLKELQLELPPAPKPAGVYKPALIVGAACYVSGHGPLRSDGTLITGRVGDSLTQAQGYDAARQTGLTILATLRAHLGSLDRIARVVKVLGMVQCTPDFGQQPAVINGCSELFAQVFGADEGVGTRSAVGMNALPGGIAVEIEAIFELRS